MTGQRERIRVRKRPVLALSRDKTYQATRRERRSDVVDIRFGMSV